MRTGRPITNRSMYYSEEHRIVLAYCAMKANRVLGYGQCRTVDPEELMCEGWWSCLRRLPASEVRYGIRNTIAAMVRFADSFYMHAYPGVPRAEGIVEGTESWDRFAARAGNSERPIDTCDSIDYLRQRIGAEEFHAAFEMIGQGRSSVELAAEEHVTAQAIRNRRDRFLRRARKLLMDKDEISFDRNMT